jgi:ectoine hydroxylase-related dioxygenase (phytanoyl-CoA dioxygenase family)
VTPALDARAVRSALTNHGYVVFRDAVAPSLCQAVLDAIDHELDIRVDDPSSWGRISDEVDQVPLWGHQSQWDIRQLTDLHAIWSTVWGTGRLWVSRDSCRFTPPWRPGRADALALHWDVDPRDDDILWFQGMVALTDCPPGAGGFRCAPNVMHNRDRWPERWASKPHGTEFRPERVEGGQIVEVPLRRGDLLVFDSHLPHGTVRNVSRHPRAVFYLQMFPTGTLEEAAVNVADHNAGLASPWWRWKPGHDRVEPGPPATLNLQGRRLLGMEPW